MKLYITGNEGYKFDSNGIYSIISEEGEVLASHLCSHIGFAFGDLTHDREKEKRISAWKERFGNDVDILHLKYCKDPDIIETDLINKNKIWEKNHPNGDFPKPSISIELSDEV
jgi:hypothetical protein